MSRKVELITNQSKTSSYAFGTIVLEENGVQEISRYQLQTIASGVGEIVAIGNGKGIIVNDWLAGNDGFTLFEKLCNVETESTQGA